MTNYTGVGLEQLISRRRLELQHVAAPDWQTLIAALGGNSAVTAFYDARYNVTAAAGVASQWDDVRGASYGVPPVTASGAAQPSYDGSNALTFNGAGTMMSTVAGSLWGLAADTTLVFVAEVIAGANYVGAISDSASANRFLGIYHASGPVIGAKGGVGATAVSSTVATGTTVRLAVASTASTTLTLTVPNTTAVTATITPNPGGNNTLTVGGYFPANGAGPSVVLAMLVLPGAASAGTIATLNAWATQSRSAVDA